MREKRFWVFSFSHLFYSSFSLWCRVHRNSAENEHTRHANKKCSPHPRLSEPRRSRISSELRRNHAVPRYVPLVAFRAESVDFFSFLVFLFVQAKRSQIGGQMECVVHSSFTSRVEEMDARWTNRSFLSRNIFVEKMCAKKEILSRLSRFAKRVSQARAENNSRKEPPPKNLKTGAVVSFSAFRLSISQKTNFSPNSLLCVLL